MEAGSPLLCPRVMADPPPYLRSDSVFDSPQIISPPASLAHPLSGGTNAYDLAVAEHREWLRQLRAWRSECRSRLGLDQTDPELFSNAKLRWTQSAFVQAQVHPFDLFFYNYTTHRYTVDRFLADVRARYGGLDAVLLWPTYPNLGVDARNAFDMIRSLPGGLPAIAAAIADLRAEGVATLWPYMVWDVGTRAEAGGEFDALLRLLNDTGAVGINGDTLYGMPFGLWQASITRWQPAALQVVRCGQQM